MMAVKPTLNCLIQRIHNTKNETSFRDDFQRFISLMTDEEKKSIFNYHGNIQVYYFVEEKMLQCSRIAFPTHLIVSNKIKKYEIEHGLKEIKPLWILIKEKEIIYNEDDLYIKDNYTLSDSISDKYINVYCYRRNDTLNK